MTDTLTLHLRGHDATILDSTVQEHCAASGLLLGHRVLRGLIDFVLGLPAKHPRNQDGGHVPIYATSVLLTYEGHPALQCRVLLERPTVAASKCCINV